jgi:hypothetical protein
MDQHHMLCVLGQQNSPEIERISHDLQISQEINFDLSHGVYGVVGDCVSLAGQGRIKNLENVCRRIVVADR